MPSSLSGLKAAILAASGFFEDDLIRSQKILREEGASVEIVSAEQGLVCGWNGAGFGLNFTVDRQLREALAADYDLLVIPGGQNSANKLAQTAHTKRFVSGFLSAGKPVAAFNEGLLSVMFADGLSGRTVSGAARLEVDAIKAGASWSAAPWSVDGNLMTVGAADRIAATAAMAVFFAAAAADEGVLGKAA